MPASLPARFAVMGNPIKHSRSPRIHTLFGEQVGLALTYDRIEVPTDQFVPAAKDFFATGGKGLNVTVPFKLDAWHLSQQHLSERAKLAMAVNTLWQIDGVIHGCNTDGVGLVADLKRLNALPNNARILLVGAGGAARGVIGPLLDAGCLQLRVVNRTAERAHALIQNWTSQNTDLSAGGLEQAAIAQGWDLVINASAASLADEAPALPHDLYAPGAWAYDMMYSKQPTPFMKQATQDGAAHVSDGLGMLVGQAAESFFIWHGVRPACDPVLTLLRQDLAN